MVGMGDTSSCTAESLAQRQLPQSSAVPRWGDCAPGQFGSMVYEAGLLDPPHRGGLAPDRVTEAKEGAGGSINTVVLPEL